MKPFLLLATRAQDAVADTEYQAFLRFGGLRPRELVRVRLEQASLDALLPGWDLTGYSGVLVGGSPFTFSDPAEQKSPVQLRVEHDMSRVLTAVLKFDVPFLGACYGIGTLGTQLGAVLDTTFGEPVTAAEVTLTAEGAADPLLRGLPRTFRAYVGHKEAIRELPAPARLLASSAACPVQMFRVGEHQYATQFHPELDLPGLLGRIHAYRHAGYFAPETVDSLVEEVSGYQVTEPARILANFTARYATS